ncbi:hypothetical protein [Magnetospirillum moscoviense]|uniref:hypothetical protein n=1 Tax=Magnetospirillum moscoviense TaxID=1437059 RepID=UPI0019F70B6D|nr:hypothetical protein [Magnetospirillum moscoviense]MBF0325861.1 hypothetical protein [Alphaproteobacteria bacterium]
MRGLAWIEISDGSYLMRRMWRECGRRPGTKKPAKSRVLLFGGLDSETKRDTDGFRRITDIYEPRADRWVMQDGRLLERAAA